MNEEIKENVVIEDFDFSMIADFFKRVDRQGPGGERETRLAASLIPSFQQKIRIADIGCGKGSQTFVLANKYDAERPSRRPQGTGFHRSSERGNRLLRGEQGLLRLRVLHRKKSLI